jgi:preprotein translocase subunit SecD
VDNAVLQKVESALSAASVKATSMSLEGTSVRARFDTPDEQLKAKDVIQKALISDPTDPPTSWR